MHELGDLTVMREVESGPGEEDYAKRREEPPAPRPETRR